jgi:hypothetical protein
VHQLLNLFRGNQEFSFAVLLLFFREFWGSPHTESLLGLWHTLPLGRNIAKTSARSAISAHPAIPIISEVLMLGFLTAPEFWEYAGESLVFVGVVLEVICESKLVLKNDTERRDKLEGRGGWVLIAGLVISLGALWATNKFFNETIADLRQQAESARKDAGEAAKSASGAKDDAKSAHDLAQSASDIAKPAKKTADAAKRESDAVGLQVTSEETQLTQVENKRAELEKDLTSFAICNAPRLLTVWWAHGKPSTAALRPFAPYQAIIEYVPYDAEARRAAFEVANALADAGWTIASVSTFDGIPDGVQVKSYGGSLTGNHTQEEWSSDFDQIKASENVASTFVDFLHSYFWVASIQKMPLPHRFPRDPVVIPPKTIEVRIGLYPATMFVTPPGEADIAAALDEFDKKWRQNFEKYLKQVPPERRAQVIAEEEETERERQASDTPCRPLTNLPQSP